MRERSGLLNPRIAHASFEDLAERTPFVARQRIRRRLRPRVSRGFSAARFLGIGLCLSALFGGGVILFHWLLTSPRFAVAAVEVRGTQSLAGPEFLARMAVTPGENIFRVNAETIAARLEGVAGIRRVHVIREFPNRVTVVAEERQPFTLANVGGLRWLDEEGVLLAAAPRAVTPELPLLSGLLPEELGSGRTPASDRAMAAIGLLRVLLRSGSALLSRLSEIDASLPHGPVFYTVDGAEIRLGSGEWEEQLARLEGLLDQISSRREPVEYVDLRFKDLVVYKPKIR